MKRIFLLIMLLPLVGLAQQIQKFKLTARGFVNESDDTKNYIVIDAPNNTKSDLYKKSQMYFTKLYVNPKEVMTLIDGESITLNGVDKQAVKIKVLYLNPSWDINYTTNHEFKDGKVKISNSLNKISTYTGNIFRVKDMSDLFNKKGEIRDEKAVKALEDYFNLVVDKYYRALTSGKEDNW